MVGHKDTENLASESPSPAYLCAYVILNKRDTLGGAAFSQNLWSTAAANWQIRD